MNQKSKFYIFISTIFILFSSCNKNEDKLEIYLLKKRIETTEGMPISKIEKFRDNKSLSKAFILGTRYDTLTNEFIYGGKFDVEQNQLELKPLIETWEIKSLDTIRGVVEFEDSGADKIRNLKPDMLHGIQFAICLNKKPVFTGYFWSKYSSYINTWNCIEYDHLDKNKVNEFEMYKSEGMNEPIKSKLDFSKYPNLIGFFKKSNKLK